MESDKKKIVVFTGAGISAESGLSTYRDSDGLWNQLPVESLATKQAWLQNPELVLAFYNDRIAKANVAQPNAAHLAIAELEKTFEVTVITQNVDDLHERAGSTNVIHLHGRLNYAQSSADSSLVYPWHGKPILMGQRCELNSQLRPNIVLFGEQVPHLDEARKLIREADKVLAVGSSLTVQPAARLLNKARFHAEKILISKEIKKKPFGYQFIRGNASNLVPVVCSNWLREAQHQ
ncbi:NAD-dependent deacetylase [Vibrio vulnificus]|nr:NAD-dependent deacylase [Vibrio vulnificus]